ncbi:MAG TPA: serine protease [Anaerolineales bacterium]|nr:serine protease [Anaerolineales bacterium]
MNPIDYIVPIFAMDETPAISFFLGTGTFIGERPLLVTAYHVVKEWPGTFAITFMGDITRLYKANLLVSDEDTDLAILEVLGCTVQNAIQLEENDIHPNQQVVCFEYGTTRTAGRAINLSPATRLGNVTRLVNLVDRFGKAGENALELSFPALRGASGAPVLSNNSFRLWGIIIANVEYHLLPAQIESVHDEKNNILEEKRYLLPQALAVHVYHVKNLISRLK